MPLGQLRVPYRVSRSESIFWTVEDDPLLDPLIIFTHFLIYLKKSFWKSFFDVYTDSNRSTTILLDFFLNVRFILHQKLLVACLERVEIFLFALTHDVARQGLFLQCIDRYIGHPLIMVRCFVTILGFFVTIEGDFYVLHQKLKVFGVELGLDALNNILKKLLFSELQANMLVGLYMTILKVYPRFQMLLRFHGTFYFRKSIFVNNKQFYNPKYRIPQLLTNFQTIALVSSTSNAPAPPHLRFQPCFSIFQSQLDAPSAVCDLVFKSSLLIYFDLLYILSLVDLKTKTKNGLSTYLNNPIKNNFPVLLNPGAYKHEKLFFVDFFLQNCRQVNNFNNMNEFTIISVPRVNLELPPATFEINSLKLLLQSSPPCHHNLKTIQKEKILKQSNDIFVKYRKKKKLNNLKEYLSKKRSYSTRQQRSSSQLSRLSPQPKKEEQVILCQRSANGVQGTNQITINKQIRPDPPIKIHKGNLYNKIFKKNLTLQEQLSRLHRCHHISSLPIIITAPEKVSHSPTPSNLDQKELLRRRFLSQKRSLGTLGEMGKANKNFKNTLKDYKIQGWNLKQSKNGFGVEFNP